MKLERLGYIYEYRKDPVPGVHARKRIGSYYRSFRTMNERRAFFACDEKLVRGSRRPKSLPNNWDDEVVTKMCTRSWKRTKKQKQWM